MGGSPRADPFVQLLSHSVPTAEVLVELGVVAHTINLRNRQAHLSSRPLLVYKESSRPARVIH